MDPTSSAASETPDTRGGSCSLRLVKVARDSEVVARFRERGGDDQAGGTNNPHECFVIVCDAQPDGRSHECAEGLMMVCLDGQSRDLVTGRLCISGCPIYYQAYISSTDCCTHSKVDQRQSSGSAHRPLWVSQSGLPSHSPLQAMYNCSVMESSYRGARYNTLGQKH